MGSATRLFGLATLAFAALTATTAQAFNTPTALIRAVYRPMLTGQPVNAPESVLFAGDTYRRLQAWRTVQPIGLGFSPFAFGPYIVPQEGLVTTVPLPVDGKPVEFQILSGPDALLQQLSMLDPDNPPVALDDFTARQVRLDAASADVTVSFVNDGTPTELLYDLVREADGWRIRDIRSMGAGVSWSLLGVVGGVD